LVADSTKPKRSIKVDDESKKQVTGQGTTFPHQFRREWWSKEAGSSRWRRHKDNGKFIGTLAGNHLGNLATWAASHAKDRVFTFKQNSLSRYDGLSQAPIWKTGLNVYDEAVVWSAGKVWLRTKDKNEVTAFNTETGLKTTATYKLDVRTTDSMTNPKIHSTWIILGGSVYIRGVAAKNDKPGSSDQVARYDLVSGKYQSSFDPGTRAFNLYSTASEVCIRHSGAGLSPSCHQVLTVECK
jgi:hypothetical protein